MYAGSSLLLTGERIKSKVVYAVRLPHNRALPSSQLVAPMCLQDLNQCFQSNATVPTKCNNSGATADALEHAAWTKGSRHLQPLRDDLNWFQHSSLDVVLFLAVTALTVCTIVVAVSVLIVKKLVRLVFGQHKMQHAKSA